MPDESDDRSRDEDSAEPRVAADDESSDGADDASIFAGDDDPVFSEDSNADDPDDSFAADLEADDDVSVVQEADVADDAAESENADADADAGAETDADADADVDANEESDATGEPAATETEADDQPVETDGEGAVGDHHDPGGEPAYPDPDDDVGGISAPPDDEEMPLADHIEEMVLRLAAVLLLGSAGTAIGLLGASWAIEQIWFDVFPYAAEEVPPPHVYHPLELWLTRIKVAALLGIMVALPMFVYQCYLFMRPGLYPNERKYYLAAVPTSVVLGGVGMLFSYLLVLPILFQYFTFYADGSAVIAFGLGDTFDLIVTLTAFLAIVFQIPLFIMLAIMMGVTTRRWLAEKRLYFWAAFFGLAFMFTFDPTAMAPILVGITMILLFEGTLLVLKWVGRE